MSGPLYEHQRTGAAWLAAQPHGRGYLGDTPGLGKTRTLLAAAKLAGDPKPVVLCPAIVRSHWDREGRALGMAPFVRSYDTVVRQAGANVLLDGCNHTLILDEGHYLKHGTSQRTKLVLGRRGLAQHFQHVFVASGTPIPKNPDEIWTVLASLFPERLNELGIGSHQAFKDRFCVTRERYVRGRRVEKILPELRNGDEFRYLLKGILLARGLDDVGLDVPPLDWQITRLDAQQADGEVVTGDDPGVRAVQAGIGSGDLESIANDPHVARLRRRLGELKVGPVVELLRAQLAGNDEKVVVFAHHRAVLAGLRECLKEFGVAYIDGDVAGPARDREIDRFQTDPACRVFVGQNIACQTGITLTAARRAVLVEPDWTAVTNQQLGARVARIGSSFSRCVAQMICLAGTLDEALVAQHHREVRFGGLVAA